MARNKLRNNVNNRRRQQLPPSQQEHGAAGQEESPQSQTNASGAFSTAEQKANGRRMEFLEFQTRLPADMPEEERQRFMERNEGVLIFEWDGQREAGGQSFVGGNRAGGVDRGAA